MKTRSAFFLLVGSLIFSALAPSCLVLIVDPFHFFHKAIIKEHGFDENNMFPMVAGIIDNYLPDPLENFDSVVIGSSTSVNYRDAMFRNSLGWQRTANISLPGSNPAHHQVILQKVLRIPNIKHIFIELSHHYSWADIEGSDQSLYHKDNPMPFYLYDDSLTNNYKYLFDANIFYESLMILIGFSEEYGMTIDAPASWWWKKEIQDVFSSRSTYKYINDKRNIIASMPFLLHANGVASFNFPNVDRRLAAPLMPYCNTDLDIIINFSIRPTEHWRSAETAERELYVRRYVTNIFSHCKNIRVYAEDQYEDIVSNPANFLDDAHYSPAINEINLGKISRDENRLSPDNISQYEERVIENVNHQAMYLEQLLLDRLRQESTPSR